MQLELDDARGQADADAEFLETLQVDELSTLRRLRRDDQYVPAPSSDPMHELWSDDQLRMLGPFLGLDNPPTSSELEQVLAHHPAARGGADRMAELLEILARFALLKGSAWDAFSLELSRRGRGG